MVEGDCDLHGLAAGLVGEQRPKARQVEGDPAERAGLLRSAEGLWHGPPLDGLDAPFVAGEVRALDELRLAAVEARVDAELESGCGGALVPELSALVARHRSGNACGWSSILALYRDGT